MTPSHDSRYSIAKYANGTALEELRKAHLIA